MDNNSYITLADDTIYHFSKDFDFSENLDNTTIAVSNICRFGGHTNKFYSVAQHQVCGSYLVEQMGGTTEDIMQFMVHDSHEPYSGGDMVSPLKDNISGFRDFEEYTRLKYLKNIRVDHELSQIVKEVDLYCLFYEYINLKMYDGVKNNNVDYDYVLSTIQYNPPNKTEFINILSNFINDYNFQPLPPKASYDLYMNRYKYISDKFYNNMEINKLEYPYLEYNNLSKLYHDNYVNRLIEIRFNY